MKWKYKIFMYIDINLLLKLFSNDRYLFKKLVTAYIQEAYQINKQKIIYNNIFAEFLNIYPRITYFKTSKSTDSIINIYTNDKTITFNRYIFNDSENKKCNGKFIYTNYVLPSYDNSSIPFTLGITKNNKFKLILSNIFYFEVLMDTYDFRKPFDNESLIIGVTNVYNNCDNLEYNKKNTCLINIFKNTFESDNEIINLPEIFTKGDVVGFGIEYKEKETILPFITKNGKLIDIKLKEIKLKNMLKGVINLKMSTGIDVNLGLKDFKFDIENLINKQKIINKTNNNLINNGFKLDKYLTDKIFKTNTLDLINESIYNLI